MAELYEDCTSEGLANCTPENVIKVVNGNEEKDLKEARRSRLDLLKALTEATTEEERDNIRHKLQDFTKPEEQTNPGKRIVDPATGFDYEKWRNDLVRKGREIRKQQAAVDKQLDYKTVETHPENQFLDGQEDEFLMWWKNTYGDVSTPVRGKAPRK